tara:strand:+ start:2137 stop:2640 length:504 start_codon:yes stop_codon:yes gene_type:complete
MIKNMAYSGRYTLKNKKKYTGNPNNVVYRSHWEKYCFMWLDKNPNIKEWSSEEIIIPYYYDVDKKVHRYYPDLKITYQNNKTYIIEIKPEKETKPPKRPDKSKRYISESLTYIKNINKWKQAKSFAKDRGWEFLVWTENNLKDMGIMPKDPPGKLKPLRKYKRKRHK